MGFDAAVKPGDELLITCNYRIPSDGTMHGLFNPLTGRGGGNHIIKLHDDISTDGILELDGVLRGHHHQRGIVGRFKLNSLLGRVRWVLENSKTSVILANLRRETI